MTKSIFKNCLAWAQKELNEQLLVKKKNSMKEYICNLSGVKERKDKIYSEIRYQVHSDCLSCFHSTTFDGFANIH